MAHAPKVAASLASSMPKSKSIAVIGAGAAGLAAVDAFSRIHDCNVVAFEMSAGVGGVWNTIDNIKQSPTNNPMYSTLTTNLPKEIMAFGPDAPFSTSIKDSFICHQDVQAYLQSFADTRNLHKYMRYNTTVQHVSKADGETQWTVSSNATNSDSDLNAIDTFDYVVVCNGHYNTRNYPSAAEMSTNHMDNFRGKVMHSADYDGPIDEIFRDKSVLVVGGRNSASDIAREIASVANVVHCSDRSAPAVKSLEADIDNINSNSSSIGGYDKYNNLKHYSGVLKYHEEEHIVEFLCGERVADIDVLIWCTGFKYDFPWLASPHNTVNSSGRRVEQLYEQLFNINDPTLSYLGLPFSVVPFPLFSIQAQLVAAVITGKHILPSYDEMKKWNIEWEATMESQKCLNDSKYHYLGHDHVQWDYSRRLYAMANGNNSTMNSEESRQEKCMLNHLQSAQEIYAENRNRKPSKVGYSDAYRSVTYVLDEEQYMDTK